MDNDLIHLISLEIPEQSSNEDGFLEIIRSWHKENINSNIYQYFLNSNNDKQVAQLFLDGLVDLIRLKSGKELYLENYQCDTEQATTKGNRIDLLLQDHENKTSIIIENKLYHHLHNDLADYWEHIPFEAQNKVGILLTLDEHTIPEEVKDYFINITHWEWISTIRNKGLPSGLPAKLYVYLNDFFNTIENMTTSYTMNEQTLFYFEHTQKVLKAAQTVEEAYKFINDQLELLAPKLGLSTYGTSKAWRNFWDQENHRHTFYTIIFDGLLKGEKTITVVIELEKKDKERILELDKMLSNDPQVELLKKTIITNRTHVHFLAKDYELSLEQIKNFSEVVLEIIQSDFEPIMVKIMKYLYPKLDPLASIENKV